ncbi:MAG TPA: DUF4442 domain-containing protein [Bdellovibrionales bacterium]|nr:DUF4442 domain-containing protein [Bdellovibrionales bacterium]
MANRGIANVLSRLPELRRKISEKVNEAIATDLKNFARQPRSLAALIESQSPWLGRRFLGVASNIVEPFLVGTGVSVAALGEEVCEIALPNIWRNQTEHGVVHTAAISATAELASRLYWERHLDLHHSELKPLSVSTRILGSTRDSLKAVFRATVGEREEVLHKLRANGETETLGTVSVYDSSGKLVSEVEIEWKMTKQLALSDGR